MEASDDNLPEMVSRNQKFEVSLYSGGSWVSTSMTDMSRGYQGNTVVEHVLELPLPPTLTCSVLHDLVRNKLGLSMEHDLRKKLSYRRDCIFGNQPELEFLPVSLENDPCFKHFMEYVSKQHYEGIQLYVE